MTGKTRLTAAQQRWLLTIIAAIVIGASTAALTRLLAPAAPTIALWLSGVIGAALVALPAIIDHATNGPTRS